MGFELNRLMKQYGVSTPGMVNYSGTAAPGEKPVAPVAPPVGAGSGESAIYEGAKNKYQSDLAAWDATKSKYDTENAAYNAYKTDYQNRLQNTPMYLQSQFNRSSRPVSAGLAWATKNDKDPSPDPITGRNIGADAYYDKIKAAGNAGSFNQPGYMKSSGYSNEDVFNATGNYWGNQLNSPVFTQTALPVIKPLEQVARGGHINFAHGGNVKTHYQTAGSVQLPSGYASVEDEAAFRARQERDRAPVETSSVNMDVPPKPTIVNAPEPVLMQIANNAAPVAPAVAAAPKPPAALPFGGERLAGIQALLAAYGPKDSAYGEDLKAARTAAKAESAAFAKMLEGAMKSPEDEKSSKAEMYFRLASAFGAPTKTGHFAENLGMVGKELGEYAKGKRASSQQKLALALESQKMKMTAAKEDLNTLRTLVGKEMDDKRAIATELIKDYIKSGEPQSAAGKQALDEGLKAGTPEYQKRVQEIGNMNIEGKLAQITASLANVGTAQANLALNQEKFQNQKTQQTKLTPAEVTMKKEAEDLIASSKQSLADLKQAYALNPNSLAGGWLDKGQQFLSEAAGSKDPVIVNTRILNNLLGSQGLAKLKATFGGAPTEGERAILMELEGIGSKTKEERGAIIKRTYKVLQDRTAREQARLDQITSGAYRATSPLEGGTD